jgi:hypothetical protein
MGNWQTYMASVEYALNNQTRNEKKTIYVWYKDQARNISTAVTRSIYLTDIGGSGGKLMINSGAEYTTTIDVTLTISEVDVLAQDLRIGDSGNAGEWVSVNVNTVPWKLSGGDGLKSIYIEFRNAYGNITWNGTSDSIILDTTPPTGVLEINDSETTTDIKVLRLKLIASDDDIASMNINEEDTWSIWQGYLAQNNYALQNMATGNKTIYVWLKDRAGNISATISASIVLADAANGSITPEAVVPAVSVPLGKKIYSYPNPAQPRKEDVKIAYSADKDGVVNIYLYNILGEKIWSASGYTRVGEKSEVVWNGRDAYGSEAGNGVYILLLTDERKKVLAKGRLTILDD